MDTEHFIVEKLTGPDASGNISIGGVDFMRLLSGESAQASLPNSGTLSAGFEKDKTHLRCCPWVWEANTRKAARVSP